VLGGAAFLWSSPNKGANHASLTLRSQLLNKDFYHLSAGTIEVKSNTPNNVAFKVTGKSSHDKATSGAVRAIPHTAP
jgi:hypothetical protein